MMDKNREAFEAWCKKEGFNTNRGAFCYRSLATRNAWNDWQKDTPLGIRVKGDEE